MSGAIGGLAIAAAGIGGTAALTVKLEEAGKFRAPGITSSVLIASSAGYAVIGLSLAFFSYCERGLVTSGALRGAVLAGWRSITAGRNTLTGRELQAAARAVASTEPFLRLLRVQDGSSVQLLVRRAKLSLVSPTAVTRRLVYQAEPFTASERVAVERFSRVFADAAEEAVLTELRSQRGLAVLGTFGGMCLINVLALAMDRAYLDTFLATDLARRASRLPEQQGETQAQDETQDCGDQDGQQKAHDSSGHRADDSRTNG